MTLDIDTAVFRAHAWPTGPGVVVVHGPAEVIEPVVTNWMREHCVDYDAVATVNLNDFRRPGGVMNGEVTRHLLRRLARWRWPVPVNWNARIALYRKRTANRKILLRLDNADGPPQVRVALPGNPASLVIVTSRSQLGGLAMENAQFVDLGD